MINQRGVTLVFTAKKIPCKQKSMQRIVKSCLYKGWFCNRRGTRKIIISPDPSLYNGLFNLLPNLSQILFHSFRIFVLDNFEKILQLRADIGYLSRSAWVE